MMLLCPECSYPYVDDARIVGEREVCCQNCAWRGPSSKLIEFLGAKSGEHVLSSLYIYIGEQVSPAIGVALIRLGLIPADKSQENAVRLARLLRRVSRAIFTAVLEGLFDDRGQDRPN